MTLENEQKLEDVFRAVLSLPPDRDLKTLQQVDTPSWDSLAHVSLVAAVEGEFGVVVDVVEALELTSFQAVRDYLEEHAT
jgi:acyl carrier protein